ncbi:MAG: ACT domain-containing protein [Candidatus Andeanibacterium colombiense]|uniref:ACT domain-containing protein n=1 Tax=Candidatus Andeanibacterium colombiense TaxID=3121345 RepID=A0AAJ5X1P7_9SPHN|nr:MAG: ACT domain-containing protein [Sphingomonadaceae bacterium]
MEQVRSTQAMIAGMDPVLDEAEYCFVTVPEGYRSRRIAEVARAVFVEDEGWSFVVTPTVARGFDLAVGGLYRRIVLTVNSALDGVGLTAAVSQKLAATGIACNMIAAFHHDHVFVPADDAEEALRLLLELQRE